MRAKKRVYKKEWTSFEEISNLQKRFGFSDGEFIEIACISSASFYLWKRKGFAPSRTISVIREELVRYFKKEYDEKMNLIWND